MSINNIEFRQIARLNRAKLDLSYNELPEWVKLLVFTGGVSGGGSSEDGYRTPVNPSMFIADDVDPISVVMLPINTAILSMNGRPSSAFSDFSGIAEKCECIAYDTDSNSRIAIVSSNIFGNIHECEKFTANIIQFAFSDDAVILLRRVVGDFMYGDCLYLSKDGYYAVYKEGEKEPIEYIDFPKGPYGYL